MRLEIHKRLGPEGPEHRIMDAGGLGIQAEPDPATWLGPEGPEHWTIDVGGLGLQSPSHKSPKGPIGRWSGEAVVPGRPFINAILSLLGRSYRLMRRALQAEPGGSAYHAS